MKKISTKQRVPVKPFKKWLNEARNKYYTLDLTQDMSDEDIAYAISDLTSYAVKMCKEGNVLITLEPVFENEE